MANKEKQKDFTFDTVAVLCSALLDKSGTVTKAQYELMSALDGTRTACAFQHQFRAVLARAKELQAQNGDGQKVEPVKAKPKRGPSKAAGAKKRNAKVESEDEADGGDQAVTPGKKKAKVEEDGQEMLPTPPDFEDAD